MPSTFAAAKLNTYARVSLETGVELGSPHRLILMLMDGALARVASARGHMQRGETAAKGRAISLAIGIVEGLRTSLDHAAGGELARNLDALYRYMGERLLAGNLRGDVAALEEVQHLLGELRAAWAAIEPQAESAPAARAVR